MTTTYATLASQYDFAHSIPETDECVRWPFTTTRAGPALTSPGPPPLRRPLYYGPADTYICERAHGAGVGLSRSCSTHGCVNPRHLAWLFSASGGHTT